MKVSTRGRYALRLMIDLAQQDTDSYTALKDISARQEISTKYLEQISALLCKAGLLQSIRGSQGGYKLAKRPEEYPIGSILRITEGTLVPVACLKKQLNNCPRYSNCATVSFWEGLQNVIDTYIDSVTLADLAQPDSRQQ